MPKYKVTLQRPRIEKSENPFHPGAVYDTTTYDLRIWEIEADNEQQIKDFYEDAVKKDFSNVRGFTLRSIEILVGNEKENDT